MVLIKLLSLYININTSYELMKTDLPMLIILMVFIMRAVICANCTAGPIYLCAVVDAGNVLGSTGACACLSCQPGTLQMGASICTPCSSVFGYCADCDFSTCYSCFGNAAMDASSNCQPCTAIDAQCTTCAFVPSPDCHSCNPGFLYNSSHLCEPCSNYLPNCMLCTSQTVCTLCFDGFGFNSASQCQACDTNITHCALCFRIQVCGTCDGVYQLLDNATLCAICYELMPDCHVCNSSTECQDCSPNTKGLELTTVPNTCVPCYLNVTDCLQCTFSTFCTACQNNSVTLYYNSTNNQTCRPCYDFLVGCGTCSSQTACLSCISNGSFLYNLAGQSCEPCVFFIPMCLTCTPAHICLTCILNTYAVSAAGTCELCSKFMMFCDKCAFNSSCSRCLNGKLVPDQTGCTKIIGCVSVNPSSSISNNCLKCDTRFFLDLPIYGRCECIVGWIVGSYCTTVIGCIGLKVVNNQAVCISCSSPKQFALSNETCVCMEHYTFNGTGCEQTCGDGYVINHACDDGNRVDGDGCSKTCQVEALYYCINNNDNNPSTDCRFQGKISLNLVSTSKIRGENAAKITFNIVPYTASIKKMDLLTSITFNADGCQVRSVSIVGKQLIVSFDYITDVNNENGEVIMNFDRKYVLSPVTKIHFQIVEASGVPLSFGQQSKSEDYYSPVMAGLSIFSLLVFAFGSVAFKLIGVQTLYTVQISWFLLTTSKFFNDFFINFNNMNISYGQFSLTQQEATLTSLFGNLGFTSNMGDNYFFFSIINGAALALFAAAHIYRFHMKNLHQKFEKQNEVKLEPDLKMIKQSAGKISKCDDILRNIYNWVLFPIFMGFFLHFMHAYISNSLQIASHQIPINYTFFIIVTFLTTSLIFHTQIWKLKWEQEKQILKEQQKNRYIPYFLIHNLIFFGVLTMMMIKNKEILNYYIGIGLIIVHLAYLVAKRPYESNVSNLAVIFNQIAILYSFLWVLSKGTAMDSAQISLILFYCYIGIIAAVNLLGIIRSILIIQSAYTRTASARLQRQKSRKRKQIIKEKERQLLKQEKAKYAIKNLIVDTSAQTNQLSLQSPFLNRNRLQLNDIMSGGSKQIYILDILRSEI